MPEYVERTAVALLLLCVSCSGPKLGGFIERSAFSDDVQRATGLTFARSLRTVTPSPGGAFRPSEVLVLPNEELLAVDGGRGRAARFTMRGGFISYLDTPGTFRAWAAAVGPGLGVYLLDSFRSTIYRFDSTGQMAGEVYVSEDGAQFAALCVDKTGLAYISDQESDEIIAVDLGVESSRGFGGFGTAPGMFVDPWGLAADERDRLYVCDAGNGRVQVLDRWGSVLGVREFKERSCTARPRAVAVDRWGNTFVTDAGCNCLRVLDASGVETFRLQGEGPGLAFTRDPGGLDVFGGRLFVADSVDGAIQVFDIEYEK